MEAVLGPQGQWSLCHQGFCSPQIPEDEVGMPPVQSSNHHPLWDGLMWGHFLLVPFSPLQAQTCHLYLLGICPRQGHSAQLNHQAGTIQSKENFKVNGTEISKSMMPSSSASFFLSSMF